MSLWLLEQINIYSASQLTTLPATNPAISGISLCLSFKWAKRDLFFFYFFCPPTRDTNRGVVSRQVEDRSVFAAPLKAPPEYASRWEEMQQAGWVWNISGGQKKCDNEGMKWAHTPLPPTHTHTYTLMGIIRSFLLFSCHFDGKMHICTATLICAAPLLCGLCFTFQVVDLHWFAPFALQMEAETAKYATRERG